MAREQEEEIRWQLKVLFFTNLKKKKLQQKQQQQQPKKHAEKNYAKSTCQQ